MKIKLSWYNPRKAEQTITEVSTLARRITLENLTKICLSSFAIHVMKEDTFIEIFLETKVSLTRRREIREDIMLMLMNLPQREPDKIVMILQVMKNMF